MRVYIKVATTEEILITVRSTREGNIFTGVLSTHPGFNKTK